MKSSKNKKILIYCIAVLLLITQSDIVMLWITMHINTHLFKLWSVGNGFFVIMTVGIIVFLSMNQRRKESLRNEKQYRSMYEDNPNPIWLYDPLTFRFVSVNDAAISSYGYSREEFLAMTVMDIRPDEDNEMLKASLSRMSDQMHESGIWRHIKKDGTLIYVNIRSHKTTLYDRDVIMVMALDNTEKYLFEQQLRQANHHLENTLNSITDSFFTLNRDWIITKANKNFYNTVGMTEDVTGKPFTEVFPGSEKNFFYPMGKKVMEEKIAARCEEFSPVLQRWLRIAAYPTEEGAAIYFTDITTEKEKDIKLKLALQRYDLASRATGDAIYDLDLLNNKIIFNQQILCLAQLSQEQVLQTPEWWMSMIHPSDRELLSLAQQRCIANKEEYWQAEYRIRTGNGEFKYVYDQGYMLFDADGLPIRLIGAIKDVDVLKRSMDQLKRTGDILNKINNPVVISDAQGCVTWVNPAYTEITGYSMSETIGKNYIDLLSGPKTNAHTIGLLHQAVSRRESFHAEFIHYTKFKKEYWAILNLSPVFDAQGTLQCYISVENDITERKEKEEVIDIQNEKLKAVSWLNSHQIRKPVASILALAQLMKSSDDELEKAQLLDLLYQCSLELDGIILEINAEASGKRSGSWET